MDSITGKQTSYSYDADNRLASATGKTGETVDYTQQNQHNGFGQRVKKQLGAVFIFKSVQFSFWDEKGGLSRVLSPLSSLSSEIIVLR